jgi:hypothetical protein
LRAFLFLECSCFSQGRRIPKSQVIIKRPTISHKTHSLRAHISDDLTEHARPEVASSSRAGSADVSRPSPSEEPQDELHRIRSLLQPPPIPDVPDWGIPAESSEPCDPVLRVRRTTFIMTLLPPHSSADETGPILCSQKRPCEPQTLQRLSHV